MDDCQRTPRLSIIIPVLHLVRPKNPSRFYAKRYTLNDALSDITRNVTIPFEIIAVVNGQESDLADAIKEDKRITKYCLNSTNVGVARSWNIGAALAEAETLCFLNDDVSIGKSAIESLCSTLEGEEVGQVGPKGANWRNCEHYEYIKSDIPTDADAISGYCFLVKKKVFQLVGGFDEAYTPAGHEEIDFSYAVRAAGLKCIVVPNLDIVHYHHHGISSRKTTINYLNKSIDTAELHQRNQAYFRSKWRNT